MLETDDLVVAGQAVGRQAVEQQDAAALRESFDIFEMLRQCAKIGGRSFDDRDAAGRF